MTEGMAVTAAPTIVLSVVVRGATASQPVATVRRSSRKVSDQALIEDVRGVY